MCLLRIRRGMAFLASALLLGSAAHAQSVVYDSFPEAGGGGFANPLIEIGDSVTLAGTDRAIVFFELGVFSELPSDSFDLRLRFYRNDGVGGEPGTLLFDTVLQDVPVSSSPSVVAVPVPGVVVPDTFTWTAVTSGSVNPVFLQSSEAATTGIFNSIWFFNGGWNEVTDSIPRVVRITAVPARV